jgi:hypothetical protein
LRDGGNNRRGEIWKDGRKQRKAGKVERNKGRKYGNVKEKDGMEEEKMEKSNEEGRK